MESFTTSWLWSVSPVTRCARHVAAPDLDRSSDIDNFEKSQLYTNDFSRPAPANSAIASSMPSRAVLIDKASQTKEADTLIAWARYPGKLIKIAIFDNHQQLPATISSYDVSEFGPTTLKSFLHRQIETGHPYTRMLAQYRMHPHISRLVNMLTYITIIRLTILAFSIATMPVCLLDSVR